MLSTEKFLRNSKIFFDGVFLSIYSHLLKKLELSKLCRKKLWGSKNQRKRQIPKKTHYQNGDICFLLFFYFCYKIIVIPV